MRRVSIEKLIELSFARMKLILLQPFSLKKWFFLMLIGFLAGAMGGSDFGVGSRSYSRESSQETKEVVSLQSPKAVFSYQQNKDVFYQSLGYKKDIVFGRKGQGLLKYFNFFTVSFFIFIVVPFILFFIWLSSRFKFVWFNSIVKNDASVVEPFRKYQKPANSLFKFYSVIFFITIGFFSLVGVRVISAILKFRNLYGSGAEWPLLDIIGTFFWPALLAFFAIISLMFLYLVVDHFLVPIMALSNFSFGQAWSRFMTIYRENTKEFWFFLLVFIGLSIFGFILTGIIFFILLIAAFLVAVVIFGVPLLLLAVLFQALPVFIVYAAIVGIPFFIAFFLLFASINLPLAVFLRSFSLYFFSSLDCDYYPLEIPA